ncbi:MAG TPA: ImmA/IrrE family metallo-endopeptidase [Pirellulales bacterium]|nr:ImmA/IrrE family metallo-endopeptidase [Pirellulales bacterium]
MHAEMLSTTQPPYLRSSEIEDRARLLLQQHGLFCTPINPVAVASVLGIEVFNASFDGDSISGMLRKSEGRYEILVNHSHPPARKRYTIAHELGHYVLHRDQVESFVDPELNLFRSKPPDQKTPAERVREIQANMFAAALLMPEELVRQQLQATNDLPRLASVFQVSHSAMGNRLNNLDLG